MYVDYIKQMVGVRLSQPNSVIIFSMEFSKAYSGTSLLEVLISMSLFSFFALQTLAFCLRLHNLTRQSLYDTRNVIITESYSHVAIQNTP